MVLEKDRLKEKQLGSDAVLSNDIDEIDEIAPGNQNYASPMPAGYSPTGKQAGKIVFHESTKKKIQLTFENITIQTIPQ